MYQKEIHGIKATEGVLEYYDGTNRVIVPSHDQRNIDVAGGSDYYLSESETDFSTTFR